MERRFLYLLFLSLAVFLMSWRSAESKTTWRMVDHGIEYTSISVPPGKIHAIKIDPKLYKFGVATAKELDKDSATVKKMAGKRGALAAINGGFFSPEFKSLGLIIDDGKRINPIKNTSWWSIFYIIDGRPFITHTTGFKENSSIEMAVQSGPRLVVNGAIPPRLKESLAERSAICVNGENNVLLLATENLLIELVKFAEILRRKDDAGFGCVDALNLDGGGSTQMYAKIDSFKLEVTGINQVANAVVVTRR